jgi:putative salt-induced outer membrane protein
MSCRTVLPVVVVIASLLAVPAASAEDGTVEEAPGGWKFRAEGSYVRTTGNTDTQTLGAVVDASREVEGDVNRYYAKGKALFAESDGDQTANRWFAEGRYERGFTERFFGFLTASYLKDKFSGYEYRFNAGPGLGYELVKTERHRLKGLLGVLWSHDEFEQGGSDSYAMGKATLDYAWQIRENLKFKQLVDYQASLQDSDVFFLKSETALEVKINTFLSLGVGYIVSYQNEPPADADETDTAFLTSLIVDF